MYNAMPHASTGMAPYYLLFGREPRLTVDNMLNTADEIEIHVDDWVKLQADKMRESHQLAGKKLHEKAGERANRLN